MISADQIRAARALLGLEQRALAQTAGVSVATLRRVEAGAAPEETLRRVARALEAAGAEFIEGGVRRHAAPLSAEALEERRRRIREILAEVDAMPVLDPDFTEEWLYGPDGAPA